MYLVCFASSKFKNHLTFVAASVVLYCRMLNSWVSLLTTEQFLCGLQRHVLAKLGKPPLADWPMPPAGAAPAPLGNHSSLESSSNTTSSSSSTVVVVVRGAGLLRVCGRIWGCWAPLAGRTIMGRISGCRMVGRIWAFGLEEQHKFITLLTVSSSRSREQRCGSGSSSSSDLY